MSQVPNLRYLKTIMKIQKPGFITLLIVASFTLFGGSASAQNINDIRWKSEAQVRSTLGEPNSVSAPIGTHATYTLWQYDNFTVAFANSKAFHLFNRNSLKDVKLNEKRSN